MNERHKNTTTVYIAGKSYVMSGEESEEYMHSVAIYLDRKIDELKQIQLHFNMDMITVLAALNLTDELFKERERCARLAKALAELEAQRDGEEAAQEDDEAVDMPAAAPYVGSSAMPVSGAGKKPRKKY